MSSIKSAGDIATLYKTCREALSSLRTTRLHGSDGESPSTETRLCIDEVQRLDIWDAEHGVANGTLDHVLRNSSHLREQVLCLLQDLNGIEVLNSATQTRSNPSHPNDQVELTTTESSKNITRTAHDFDSPLPRSSELETRSTTTSSSLGLDTDFSFEDSEPSSSLKQAIARASDTITLLFELGPSLRDPAPHDRLHAVQYPSAAQPDLQHVRRKFPKAEQSLVDRLGYANWERRQDLINLKDNYPKIVSHDLINRSPDNGRSELRKDDFCPLEDDESQSDISSTGSPSAAPLISLAASDTNKSESKFNFSGIGTRSTPGTDLSHGVYDARLLVTSDEQINGLRRAQIPHPPPPNQHYDGEPFDCAYCNRRITDLKGRREWIKHVFSDIEPYMCTFDDCKRPDRKYGDRHSWWEHERQNHRVEKAWECGPCESSDRQPEFNSAESFELHIKEHHPDLSAQARRSIQGICEKIIRVMRPQENCPLCLESVYPLEDVEAHRVISAVRLERLARQHIANHLEQLVMFVAVPAGKSLVDHDDDTDFLDDSDSDSGPKADIESIFSDDRNLSKKEVRLSNIRRFLDADTKTNDVSIGIALQHQLEGNDASGHAGIQQPAIEKKEPVFPIRTVLHPRNDFFYGRDKLLKDIHGAFESPGTIYVVYGVGGVGKTLAAVEYSCKHPDRYDGIFWLQADTAPGLTDSFIQMTTALGLEPGADDQKRAIERGREWLQNTDRRWLLIFDNVDQWEAISHYLPHNLKRTRGSVLITTQKEVITTISDISQSRELEVLDEESGSKMLLGYLHKNVDTDIEKDLAREISGFVGGLPVAIAHVAGYADFSEYTLEELLDTFREWRRRTGVATDEADDLPASFRQAAFSYDETLAMVWNVTLRELSRDAQDLTYILAYLNCEAVPESMLWGFHEDASLDFLDIREKIRSKRIQNQLVKRRLVQFHKVGNEKCFTIHRSLQRSIRETLAMDKAKQQTVFDQSVSLVREVFPVASPVQQPLPEKWSEYRRLLPHLHSLRDVFYKSKPSIIGSAEFAKILSDAGINQWEGGFTKEGLMLLKTAEDVLDSISFDQQDVMRADIHAIIALMYDNTGISTRHEALRRRQKALEIRKAKVNGASAPRRDDEILFYNARMDYAISLLQFNRYKLAEPIIEDCLRKYRLWGSEDEIPYEYAKYYNKMALVRLYQGKFEESIRLAKLGVHWMGKTGNFSLQSRFNFDLACILLQTNSVDEALRLHRDIFDARLEKLGQSNELTLHSRYAIGAIYELKGQVEEAEIWLRRALDYRRAASWPEEAVSRAQFHLARVLRVQGKLDTEKTKELYTESLEVLHRLLPLDHPPELQGVTDETALFDHVLTICGARFTGKGLLKHVQ